jgi:hypothetical protein
VPDWDSSLSLLYSVQQSDPLRFELFTKRNFRCKFKKINTAFSSSQAILQEGIKVFELNNIVIASVKGVNE